MTLGEVLDEMNQNQMVNIGASFGFIFCGKVSDFLMIEQELTERSKEKMVQLAKRSKSDMNYKLNRINKKEQKKIITSSRAEIERKNAYNAAKRSVERAMSWKPLMQREVVDYYNSIVDKRFINLIIEGDEIGNYWCIDEYQAAHGR